MDVEAFCPARGVLSAFCRDDANTQRHAAGIADAHTIFMTDELTPDLLNIVYRRSVATACGGSADNAPIGGYDPFTDALISQVFDDCSSLDRETTIQRLDTERACIEATIAALRSPTPELVAELEAAVESADGQAIGTP